MPSVWGLNSAWDSLIGGMIAQRNRARIEKDFARADEIRDGLAAAGVLLMDNPTGTDWELSNDFDATKLGDLADD